VREKSRVVVLGIIGRTPFAGVAWQALHYLEALRRLGCDVYYVEDTGTWAYDADRATLTEDHSYPTRYIGGLMQWAGFGNRWAYRASGPRAGVYGLPAATLDDILRTADVLLNLTGATVLRDEHLRVPTRIYVETDPVLPQIEIAQGHRFTIDLLAAHTHHFSFGENLGTPGCPLPTAPFTYRPTRQPVVRDWWQGSPVVRRDGPAADAPLRFTTVANWQQDGKDVTWNGETYTWSKHHEFMKVRALPERTPFTLELALACGDVAAIRTLTAHRWRVIDALAMSRDHLPYRRYITRSDGEFTVAKDQNVRLRSGWFSDRSACYLAAGKPVVTQDTGFGRVLPTGRGLFAFTSMDDALAAFEAIGADPSGHAKAAAEIAAEYFDADRVVGRLLADAGL
jgi:hypothetical protein